MANQKAIEKKQSEVSALAEKMKGSKLVLLTDYRGISVEDVTGLRSNLRKIDAEYKVIKNNITRRALAEAEIEGLEDLLVGPTAVVLSSEDYLEPLKAVCEYAKNNESNLSNKVKSLNSAYFPTSNIKVMRQKRLLVHLCWWRPLLQMD